MVHTVTLQRQATTVDATGQQARTWTNVFTSFASIEPVRGREYFQASGEKADITHDIRMRARTDKPIVPRDRVQFGSRYFDIKSIADVGERGREWQLMCIEVLHTT
jgi:SPP1 family predicted phage head-tail adaptor